MTRRDLGEEIRAREEERARRKPVKFLTRNEVLERIPVTYVTLWKWMQDNKFPRAREVGGKSLWVEGEIDAFIKDSPLVKLKGDPEDSRANNFHRSSRRERR